MKRHLFYGECGVIFSTIQNHNPFYILCFIIVYCPLFSLKTLKNLNLENPTQSHGQYTDSPFKGWKVMVGGGQSHAMSWTVVGCPMTSRKSHIQRQHCIIPINILKTNNY